MRIELPLETERLVIHRSSSTSAAWSRAMRKGRGYATEASAAIVDAAFATGFERITAMTSPDNAAALHVLRKLRFTPEGETTFEGREYAFFVCHR